MKIMFVLFALPALVSALVLIQSRVNNVVALAKLETRGGHSGYISDASTLIFIDI